MATSPTIQKPRFLNRYFELSAFGTNIRTEILAGISTYLSLAYIFVVNPAILGQAGMDVSAVLFATVLASGLSTLFMGLWARLPFALAPGLEMNGFFAFVVVGILGLTWQQALGVVFWSGVLCMLAVPARQRLIDAIPDALKMSIAVSVGVFVVATGLRLAGIIVFENGFPKELGLFISSKASALYIGLAVAVLLVGWKRLKFQGGLLVAIIVAAVFCKQQGITVESPAQFSATMFAAVGQLELLSILWDPRILPALLVFFLIDFYGSLGKFIGLTKRTNLTKEDGTPVRLGRAMYVDGGGTVVGAWVGTSSIITYVVSAVGIAAGGRTGITAIVCAFLMACSLLFTPLVGLIPVEATTGVLVYVGWLLVPKREHWKSGGAFDVAVAVAMGAVVLLTFALDKAMLLGFALYFLRQLFSGKVNWYLAVSAILLTLSVAMQYTLR